MQLMSVYPGLIFQHNLNSNAEDGHKLVKIFYVLFGCIMAG